MEEIYKKNLKINKKNEENKINNEINELKNQLKVLKDYNKEISTIEDNVRIYLNFMNENLKKTKILFFNLYINAIKNNQSKFYTDIKNWINIFDEIWKNIYQKLHNKESFYGSDISRKKRKTMRVTNQINFYEFNTEQSIKKDTKEHEFLLYYN